MTTKHLRVALIGKSGAGKSVAAEALRECCGFHVLKTGAICRSISNILFGNEDKASTQRLDDALTAIDPSIFLRAALREAPASNRVLIDSLRFASDVELLRPLGYRLVRVEADASQRAHRLAQRRQVFDLHRDGSHRSETELDNVRVDVTLKNEGSIQDFTQTVINTIASL